MGLLRHARTGRRQHLEPDHLVGRAPDAALRLDADYVSMRHAVLRWSDNSWEVRDLGSRNRTYLDGEALEPGVARVVRRGSTLAFGEPEQLWHVVEDDAPRMMALPETGDEPVVLDGDLLVLPPEGTPIATIYSDARGLWMLEMADAVRPATHGEWIQVGAGRFRLCIPQHISRTAANAGAEPPRLRDLSLVFAKSRDEEHVEISVIGNGKTVGLGARAHNYLLLLLARRRLAEAGEGFAAGEQGWLYQEELLTALGLDPAQLNTDVFRIRKQFAVTGVIDPGSIIERRPRTGQLRIGCSKLQVRDL